AEKPGQRDHSRAVFDEAAVSPAQVREQETWHTTLFHPVPRPACLDQCSIMQAQALALLDVTAERGWKLFLALLADAQEPGGPALLVQGLDVLGNDGLLTAIARPADGTFEESPVEPVVANLLRGEEEKLICTRGDPAHDTGEGR